MKADTDQFVYIELQGCVVTLLGVIQVYEEEDVSPDVMFVVDVMVKALTTHTQVRTEMSVFNVTEPRCDVRC